jgi:hypothetical protein
VARQSPKPRDRNSLRLGSNEERQRLEEIAGAMMRAHGSAAGLIDGSLEVADGFGLFARALPISVQLLYNSGLFLRFLASGQPPVSATLRPDIRPPYPHPHRHDDRGSKPGRIVETPARAGPRSNRVRAARVGRPWQRRHCTTAPPRCRGSERRILGLWMQTHA